MEVLATAFILALFIQLLTGRFKAFISDQKTQIVALIIGVALCLVYQAGILQMLGLVAITITIPAAWAIIGGMKISFAFFDYILTGIAVSGGASGIYDFGKTIVEWITKAAGNKPPNKITT